MGAFTFVGVAVTSSTGVIFGHILAIFGIILATVTTNVAANVVAPANALVNLSPSYFTFNRGALLTAVIGIFFQPWRLLSSSESFVYTWLVGYSAVLGPIGGVMVADYHFIRKRELIVEDLYSSNPTGAYYYSGGFNLAAVAALVVGILPVIPGFLEKVEILSNVPKMFRVIYGNAWFISTFSPDFSIGVSPICLNDQKFKPF
ncbi:purine-uracil permease NCS1-like [Cucurbita moschata]|uniref:Purine-uracil permease NCS1-like n=1 Tax=Cucurbita moschata TaxID=3662 RepID=A0A6J1H8S0_CUCMO|nr:purine-uracil permease NCS1-like [Cucurbita moschata]